MRARVLLDYFGIFLCFFVSAHCLCKGILGKSGYIIIEGSLKPKLKKLRKEKDFLIKEKKILAKKVSLLKNTIDPDLLEQYEWRSLGHIPKDKKVIILPKKSTGKK